MRVRQRRSPTYGRRLEVRANATPEMPAALLPGEYMTDHPLNGVEQLRA